MGSGLEPLQRLCCLQITWASVEWMVESPKAVVALPDSDLPPPPITVMSLNMLTFLNEKQKVNEIAAITCIVNHEGMCSNSLVPTI